MMKIEVAIPCYNEEKTIVKVVKDFRKAVPQANIVVYDNNSTDESSKLAHDAGAKVITSNRQGKGYVVQDIFERTEADILVMVDGDDSFEANDVFLLIDPIISGNVDMTIGTRLHSNPKEFRKMHHLGNRLLTWILNKLFRTRFTDILSGYRAFSRRFIERIPIISKGFEVETEMMIQSLEYGISIKEVPIGFRDRPPESCGKLNTFRDGYKIIALMIALLRDHKPFLTFSLLSLFLLLAGAIFWIIGFLEGNINPGFDIMRRIGVILMVISFGFFTVGLILNTINTRVRELMSLLRRKK